MSEWAKINKQGIWVFFVFLLLFYIVCLYTIVSRGCCQVYYLFLLRCIVLYRSGREGDSWLAGSLCHVPGGRYGLWCDLYMEFSHLAHLGMILIYPEMDLFFLPLGVIFLCCCCFERH